MTGKLDGMRAVNLLEAIEVRPSMHLEDHRNSRSATDHGITGQQHVQQVSTRRVRQIWDVAIQHHIIRNLTLECIPRQVVMGKIRTMLEHVSSDGRIDALQILVEIRPGLRDLLLFFGQTVVALEKECVGALQIGDQLAAGASATATARMRFGKISPMTTHIATPHVAQ